jgi:holliday junction DNA helicase RuvA
VAAVIASLRGRLAGLLPDGAVIEVGGVGYRVHLSPKALAGLPRSGEVHVHTVTWVREDALALYGFPTAEERRAFEVLLGVGGVGPKLALAVLGVHSPEALDRAVRAGDIDALTLVPGVGRKGAARLLLELKGRLGEDPLDMPDPADGSRPVYAEVREALGALGYKDAEIKAALESMPADAVGRGVEDLLKLALRAVAGPARGGAA